MSTFDSITSVSMVQKNQLFGIYFYFKFLDTYEKLRQKEQYLVS